MSWVNRVESVAIPPEVASWDLVGGESAVLSLALTQNTSDYTIILDDRAARRCAKVFGITTIGTGRLLLLAKKRGIISQVSPRLQSLRESGLWISDRLFNLIRVSTSPSSQDHDKIVKLKRSL